MVDLYSQTKLVIIPIRRKQGSTPTTGKRDRSRLGRSGEGDKSEFHLILKDQEHKDLKRTTRPEHDLHCSRKRVLDLAQCVNEWRALPDSMLAQKPHA